MASRGRTRPSQVLATGEKLWKGVVVMLKGCLLFFWSDELVCGFFVADDPLWLTMTMQDFLLASRGQIQPCQVLATGETFWEGVVGV